MRTERAEARYDAAAIRVLTGLEAVRQRPAMYIGSTGPQGMHHLVFEVVQNAIDEALAGHCTRIDVTVHADGSCSVEDDGRGIPTDLHPIAGRPALEVVFTTLHAGGKFGGPTYHLPGGLHGVGLACVNALSSWLLVEVWRDGWHHRQRFTRGAPEAGLVRVEETDRNGTRVRFAPDPDVFSGPETAAGLDSATLQRRLEELAFLHPGVHIRFADERTGGAWDYDYATGIVGFVEHLNTSREPLHRPPVHIAGVAGLVEVEAALQWTTAYAEDVATYVNSISTTQGGTHLEGMKRALTRVINAYAHAQRLLNREVDEKIAGYDIREGLTAVLSVRMVEPEFEGQTKSVLTSREATAAVEHVVGEQLAAVLSKKPDVAAAIVGKALEASRARAAARRASERARYRTVDSLFSKEVYQRQFGIRSKNWHQSARWITDQQLLGSHAALTRVHPGARVLDTCCGSGVVGASFRDRVGHITGLDLTAEMRAKAATRLDEVVAGDVYEIPFPEATFDMVVNREVLHLLPHPDRPVAEMFRVLKPGGQFVVGQILPYGAIDAPWMFRVFKKKQPLFFNNFTDASFHQMLAEAGFVDIEMVEYHQWEDIDLWIDTHETPNLHRHEIRDLYYRAPAEVRAAHPFEVSPSGAIQDCWRWCIFSAWKPLDATVLEHFTARAATYDQSSSWCTDDALGDLVLSLTAPQPEHAVLDIACGTGLVSRLFTGKVARLVGVDITEAMFDQARPHLDELVVSPAESLPFPDATFDIVVCRQGIQFMDDAAAVGEMARVLKPGGKVCLIHLCAYGLEDRDEYFEILRLRNPARRNFYLREDLARLMTGAGLRDVVVHDYVSVEDVDVWSDNGAIAESRREGIREVYRHASAAFTALHAAAVTDTQIVDHMLFGVAVGTK